MTVFGDEFSYVLRNGCSDLMVYPEWVLAVLAYESGLNPLIHNAIGARGMWQKMPKHRGKLPLGTPLGSKQLARKSKWTKEDLLENPRAKEGADCLDVWDMYPVDDPAQQLRDAFKFWTALCVQFDTGVLPTREHFYCLNLWPAALAHGHATHDTKILTTAAAYKANAQLDKAKKGYVTIRDLGPALDGAVVAHKAKIDAELHNLLVLGTAPKEVV